MIILPLILSLLYVPLIVSMDTSEYDKLLKAIENENLSEVEKLCPPSFLSSDSKEDFKLRRQGDIAFDKACQNKNGAGIMKYLLGKGVRLPYVYRKNVEFTKLSENHEIQALLDDFKKLFEAKKADDVHNLIKKGLFVLLKNELGESPLLIAQNPEVYEALSSYLPENISQDITGPFRDDWGHTPLHAAALQGNVKMIDYFYSRKKFTSDVSKKGDTVLHAAVMSDSLEAVRKVYDNDKSLIDKRDEKKETPLHKVSFIHTIQNNQAKEIVDFLLEKGADLNAQNKEDNTLLLEILDYYSQLGSVERAELSLRRQIVLHLLGKPGINVDLVGRLYFTALGLVICSVRRMHRREDAIITALLDKNPTKLTEKDREHIDIFITFLEKTNTELANRFNDFLDDINKKFLDKNIEQTKIPQFEEKKSSLKTKLKNLSTSLGALRGKLDDLGKSLVKLQGALNK